MRRPSDWLVVFDMDDTLIVTSPTFEHGVLKLCLRLAELGIPMDDTRGRLNHIDLERVTRLGYGKGRWPESMGMVYRSFVEEGRLDAYLPALEAECVAIGFETYAMHPEVREGAREVLETLRPRVRLALATRGDLDLQRARLEHSGLEHHFDAVYILEWKNPDAYRRILAEQGHQPARAFMIGDGMRSDVNPSLEVGMHAIHVRGQSWEHERVEPRHEAFASVDRLEEIPALVFAAMDEG